MAPGSVDIHRVPGVIAAGKPDALQSAGLKQLFVELAVAVADALSLEQYGIRAVAAIRQVVERVVRDPVMQPQRDFIHTRYLSLWLIGTAGEELRGVFPPATPHS